MTARLDQMSVGGSFIVTDSELPVGTELMLLFRLPDCETEFVVSATVRWCAPSGVGVQFGAMRGREIYDLSRFLVDKPTVPPPAPLPRSPVRAAPPLRPPRRVGAPERAAEPTPTPRAVEVSPAAPAVAALAPPAGSAPPSRPPLPVARATAADAAGEPAPSAELSALREQLRLLDAVLAERDAQIRRLESTRAPAGELDALRRELADREARLGALDAALAEREASLAALRSEHDALVARVAQVEDDLTQIRGVGPAFARALRELGIRRLEQVAALQSEELERIARELKIPVGRIRRYDWAGHAATLVAERDARRGER